MDEIEQVTPTQEPAVEADRREQTLRTIGIVIIALVILGIMGLAGYGLVTHPSFTAALRDISIIVLALVTIVIGAFLAILIFQLQSLTALLRDEIKPILEAANDTASTVRGTTTFISDAVVTPVITAASYASAVRQTIKTLTGSPKRKDRSRKGSDQG
jgi:hypothetical protein